MTQEWIEIVTGLRNLSRAMLAIQRQNFRLLHVVRLPSEALFGQYQITYEGDGELEYEIEC